MQFTYYDAIGTTGSAILIIDYFLLQINAIKSNSYIYYGLNLAGALLILFSLFFTPNKASVVIELFWIAISAYGIIRKRISNRI